MLRHVVLRRFAVAISCGLTMGIAGMAHADIITLQMPDMPGDEAFATKFGLPLDSIRVVSVGNSIATPDCPGGAGGGCGKPAFTNVEIVKKFGPSTAPLFLEAVLGNRTPWARINFFQVREGVPTKYYTITLNDVVVRSFGWVGSATADAGADAENINLVFGRITMLDNVTGVRACYDLTRGTTC
jgi:type VI protein secretion system component Hcp